MYIEQSRNMKKREQVIKELIECLNQGNDDEFNKKIILYEKYFSDQHLLLNSSFQNIHVIKKILDYKVNKNEFFTQLQITKFLSACVENDNIDSVYLMFDYLDKDNKFKVLCYECLINFILIYNNFEILDKKIGLRELKLLNFLYFNANKLKLDKCIVFYQFNLINSKFSNQFFEYIDKNKKINNF